MILERFKVPEKDQVLVPEAALRRTVTQIFEKLGLTADDAADGADVLTTADLRGVETHGVSNMLRAYVRDYKAGKLDPTPGWQIVDLGYVHVSIDSQGQRARNWRGCHCKQLGTPALSPQGSALSDTEAVLLVYDRQPQVGKVDAVLNEGMSPHGNMNLA